MNRYLVFGALALAGLFYFVHKSRPKKVKIVQDYKLKSILEGGMQPWHPMDNVFEKKEDPRVRGVSRGVASGRN